MRLSEHFFVLSIEVLVVIVLLPLVERGSISIWDGVGVAVGALLAGLLIERIWKRKRKRDESLTWQDIEARFKAVEQKEFEFARARKSSYPLCATQNEAPRDDTWSINCGLSELTESAKRICAIAGRKLKADGYATSDRLRRSASDIDRWLWFLVEIGEAPEDKRIDGFAYVRGATQERHYFKLYKIKLLMKSSLAGCETCIAKQIIV